VKVETPEALLASLAASGPPRILGGDLNTPARRRMLVGLEALGMADVFRTLNGSAARDLSWAWPRHRGGYRLDHVLASASLRPTACRYHHDWRERGLSDHSGVEAAFGTG
jgi:endonuclease/exonuclease/phosphatase family metal-dependent hydrolase